MKPEPPLPEPWANMSEFTPWEDAQSRRHDAGNECHRIKHRAVSGCCPGPFDFEIHGVQQPGRLTGTHVSGGSKKLDILWLDHLLHTLETLISTIIQRSECFPHSSCFPPSPNGETEATLIWHMWHLKQQRGWGWGYAIRPFQSKIWNTGPCWFHTPINLILCLIYWRRICRRNQLLIDLL